MKTSIDSLTRNVIIPVIFMMILCCPSISISGNKWMMEKNREELLLINSEIFKKLRTTQKDGKVILKGSVVIRDGQTVLQIHQIQNFTSAPDVKNEPIKLNEERGSYEAFLREEPLSEIPILESSQKE